VGQHYRAVIATDNVSDLLIIVGQVRQPSTLDAWSLGKEHLRLPDEEAGYNALVIWRRGQVRTESTKQPTLDK
jgi:hypothetical protein